MTAFAKAVIARLRSWDWALSSSTTDPGTQEASDATKDLHCVDGPKALHEARPAGIMRPSIRAMLPERTIRATVTVPSSDQVRLMT